MRGPHPGKAVGLGLDHGLEVVTPVGALLLRMLADSGEVFFVQGLVGQGAISVAEFLAGACPSRAARSAGSAGRLRMGRTVPHNWTMGRWPDCRSCGRGRD